MSEAINQAKLAMGLTSPNPPVGAVIVSEHNNMKDMCFIIRHIAIQHI